MTAEIVAFTGPPTVNAELPIVDIVFVQDWDMEDLDVEWGDWAAMAEYLAQWDFGDETDAAHTVDYWQGGTYDDTYQVRVNGLTYWLNVESGLRYAGLTRRPVA